MVDATMIQQCADPDLKPAIVEKFIEQAGATNPFAITVRSGNRVILVPQAKTANEAMATIRQYAGKAVVRVGITQYPAGLGASETADLNSDMVDACANIRMGTALFGKVYRIVTKWLGAPSDQAFQEALIAWQSGTFEGKAVFLQPDPGKVALKEPTTVDAERAPDAAPKPADQNEAAKTGADDPNKASIRIDLSGIGR